MSIIHFKETNIIFDIDQLCYLKIGHDEKKDKHKLIAKFTNSKNELDIFYGTEDETKEKFEKMIEKIGATERNEEITNCQWVYGEYYQMLCNLKNASCVEIGNGVDPGGWHVFVINDGDRDSEYSITYSSLEEVNKDMETIALFIEGDDKLLRLQEVISNDS